MIDMDKYEYQSDFARKHFADGKEVGLRLAVLCLADEKLGGLAPGDEAAILAQDDPGVLTVLNIAIGRAADAAAVRVVLDRLRSP